MHPNAAAIDVTLNKVFHKYLPLRIGAAVKSAQSCSRVPTIQLTSTHCSDLVLSSRRAINKMLLQPITLNNYFKILAEFGTSCGITIEFSMTDFGFADMLH